jgi:hypothetical protein
VSDEDLRFPPPTRREPAKFEPPPWERDQFDELAKTRLEPGPAEGAKLEQPLASAPAATAAEQVAEAVLESARSGAEEPGPEGEGGSVAAPREIDQKHLDVMMMGLRAEEPRPEEAYWKVTTIAGVMCSLIGLAITVWAIVAFATLGKSGARGMTLASVLMLFGLGFAGGGIWVVAKTLRQQGVL